MVRLYAESISLRVFARVLPRSARGAVGGQTLDRAILVPLDLCALVGHHRVRGETPCAHLASGASDAEAAHALDRHLQRPSRAEGAVLLITLDQNPNASHDAGSA